MLDMYDVALLTVEQMYAADAAAIGRGTPGRDLMEAAGEAIAREVIKRWPKRPVAVLCGPGNNGGDGFVAARLIAEQGWPVRLALLGEISDLRGDAALYAERWQDEIYPLTLDVLDGDVLVIDALFGAGLSRPLDGIAKRVIETLNGRQMACLAVDIPSGIDGDSGEILGGENGVAAHAVATVTFFRRKPGHLLMPGRDHSGDVVVADIGISDDVLGDINPLTFANGPGLWRERFPHAGSEDNKYSRGHGVIVGGGEMTGAARLAATAARRLGAGLVSIVTPPESFGIYAAGDPGNLVKVVEDAPGFSEFLADPRINAILIGPGSGVTARTRGFVMAALATGKPVVLDADALSVFADNPHVLFTAIAGPVLLTPHDGEFRRLFDLGGDKLSRTRAAAQISGAVVLLKGADTVIAAPDGRAAINEGAPPSLATAGSGDVLAGFITGLLARGADTFDSACIGAWLHGRAAAKFGPGLIAEDLAEAVSTVLTELDAQLTK